MKALLLSPPAESICQLESGIKSRTINISDRNSSGLGDSEQPVRMATRISEEKRNGMICLGVIGFIRPVLFISGVNVVLGMNKAI